MFKFIYVFGIEGRDAMLDMKYQQVKSDEVNGVYVFLNRDTEDLFFDHIPCVFSDVLTF